MNESQESLEAVPHWLTYDQVADLIGVSRSRVSHLVGERRLAAVRRHDLKAPGVPADFVQDGQVVKGLSGTLTLLADHGFDHAEAIAWLYAADDTLPGRPIDALRENRGREVRRRAQAIV